MAQETFYHASRTPLVSGLVLESRFHNQPLGQRLIAVIRRALADGHASVKSLLLADALLAAYQNRKVNLPNLLREVVFEVIRENEFAGLPSRIGGRFACRDLATIQRFQQMVNDRPHLYTCQITGGAQVEVDLNWIAQMNLYTPVENQIGELQQRARRYWNRETGDDPVMEIVTNGTLTILADATISTS